MRKQLLLILAAAVLLRLPFLNQAWQLDDYYYLKAAERAQTDPLHPHHAKLIFLGIEVDLRGHPHPPGNSWFLAGVMKLLGAPKEAPYHAAYIPFSLIAAGAMWALARRFAPRRALEATLLFLAVPAFTTSGNSLMADLPFLAFWMAATALFIEAVERRSVKWLCGAAAAMALAAIMAHQAVFLLAILGFYLWQRARAWRAGWMALMTPLAVVAAFQLFERLTSGALPAQILTAHFRDYGLQRFAIKAKNAGALAAHLGWMLTPVFAFALVRRGMKGWRWAVVAVVAAGGVFADASPLFWGSAALGVAVLLWLAHWRESTEERFLTAWALVYFAASVAVFYAGAARYLLPMAAPLVLLAVRRWHGGVSGLRLAAAGGFALALAFAWVDYQHWDGYRQFVKTAFQEKAAGTVWVDSEWGIRQYAEERGARPLVREQVLAPGDWLIRTDLTDPMPHKLGESSLKMIREMRIEPTLPLRLMGLGARSGYQTIGFGLRAFDVTAAPVDRISVMAVTASGESPKR